MTQTNNRFFDEAARLMNDAAGVAQGVRREFDTLLRSQAERILADLDVVRRSRLKKATLFEMEETPELRAVTDEYMRLAAHLWAGGRPLDALPMKDRDLFEFLGFDWGAPHDLAQLRRAPLRAHHLLRPHRRRGLGAADLGRAGLEDPRHGPGRARGHARDPAVLAAGGPARSGGADHGEHRRRRLRRLARVLDDPLVSKRHARLEIGQGRVELVDLNSANGILVGGAPVGPNRFGSPSPAGLLLVAASAALVSGAAWALARGGDRAAPGRWPLRAAMVVLGGAGALLFALTPGWTYADAVRGAVAAGLGGAPVAVAAPALLTGAATLVGAVVAGTVAGRFRVERPRAVSVLRSLVGGALMAAGASFVPGGNDSLLLWAVPGGSVSGLLAYLLMTGTILAWLAGLRLLSRPRARRIGPA
mgnify:CR=1 FL=1